MRSGTESSPRASSTSFGRSTLRRPSRPTPGCWVARIPRRSLPDRPLDRDVQTAQQAVEEKVLTALRVLFQSGKRGCTECHRLSNKLDPLIDSKQFEQGDDPTSEYPADLVRARPFRPLGPPGDRLPELPRECHRIASQLRHPTARHQDVREMPRSGQEPGRRSLRRCWGRLHRMPWLSQRRPLSAGPGSLGPGRFAAARHRGVPPRNDPRRKTMTCCGTTSRNGALDFTRLHEGTNRVRQTQSRGSALSAGSRCHRPVSIHHTARSARRGPRQARSAPRTRGRE